MQRKAQPGKEAEVDACRQGVKKESWVHPVHHLPKCKQAMGKPNWGLERGRKRSVEVTQGHPDSSLGMQGHQKRCLDPGVVAHICNPSQHGEAGAAGWEV